jgi:hypothetical protein
MYKFLTNPNGITHLDLSGTECALENVSLETNSIYREIIYFIGKFDIFPLICAADKVWITELTLIHKSIRSVRHSHVQVYPSILFIHSHYDVTDKNNSVSYEGLDRHYHKYPSSFLSDSLKY